MSLRTLKARPKPNLESPVKRKPSVVEDNLNMVLDVDKFDQMPNALETNTSVAIVSCEKITHNNDETKTDTDEDLLRPSVNGAAVRKLKSRPKPKLNPAIRARTCVLPKESDDDVILVTSQPEQQNHGKIGVPSFKARPKPNFVKNTRISSVSSADKEGNVMVHKTNRINQNNDVGNIAISIAQSSQDCVKNYNCSSASNTSIADEPTQNINLQKNHVIEDKEYSEIIPKRLKFPGESGTFPNINETTTTLKEVVDPSKTMQNTKQEVRKLRVKINPRITSKKPGVETLKIKIINDEKDGIKDRKLNNQPVKAADGNTKHSNGVTPDNEANDNISEDGLHLSFEIDSSDESSTSNSVQETSSTLQSKKSNPMTYTRRFNMPKPNLSTANRTYRPQQFSTTYGKLSIEAKQRFKEKFGNQSPEHSKLTMFDLIFYNPPKNPMTGEQNKKKEIGNESELTTNNNGETSTNGDASNTGLSSDLVGQSEEIANSASTALDTNGLPVPQLKLTADGKIIIAPESLVVPSKNDSAKNESRPLIVENDLTHHKILNCKATKDKHNYWSFQETLKFYKALHATGSDFALMVQHFPGRTRNCLKRKFKREECSNGHLIDQVLGRRADVDFGDVEKELALNRMWNEIEKSCQRYSEHIPEIADIRNGVASDIFLSRREKTALKKKSRINFSKTNKTSEDTDQGEKVNTLHKENGLTVSSLTMAECPRLKSSNLKLNKPIKKNNRERKVLRLKDYLKPKVTSSISQSHSTTKSRGNRFKSFIEQEISSSSVSSDEEVVILEEEPKNSPIVVNTSIESSGIKYTKSVTFNPGNMDIPVEINETIAHSNDTEIDTSADIIEEIENILSTDES